MKTIFLILITTLITLSTEANGSTGWNSHADLFAEVSDRTGVAVDELAAIAAIESSFRPKVKASTSSATGLFQFTKRTWRVTLESYGEQYGLSADTDIRDPMANALMGAEYIKENRRVLQRKMGRYPSLLDVYLAHLIAPRRVAAIEDINPKASMAYLYPNLAKYNYTLFYKKSGESRSVKEFKKFIGGKVWRAYNKYVEPAKLALVNWKREQDAIMFANAMSGNDEPWRCASPKAVREWGESFKEKSLEYVKSYLNVAKYKTAQYTMAVQDNGNRREPFEGAIERVIYLDRRWIA